MTSAVIATSIAPTVIDEAHMDQFTNDQLAYKAWIGTDFVQEILFDEENLETCLSDAKFEVAHAAMALRVLVRRLTNLDADELRKAVDLRRIEIIMQDDADAPSSKPLPAWETLQ